MSTGKQVAVPPFAERRTVDVSVGTSRELGEAPESSSRRKKNRHANKNYQYPANR